MSMSSLTTRALFVLIVALGLLPAPLAAQSNADYTIGPQDVLAIVVFDQADLSGKYAVEIDGSFTFPYIGRIKAGGLTIRAFEADLRTRLADGFFKNPQVAVAVESYLSQRVFIAGEVRTPGTLPLTGGLTLLDAIAKAGFTTADAGDEVVVIRGGRGAGPAPLPAGGVIPEGKDASGKTVVTVSLTSLQSSALGAQNIVLQDGDTVYVAPAVPVYVYGQVKSPGSYPVKSDTTVLQVLTLAGGATPLGAVNRVRIIRIINGEKKEVRVALSDRVQPGDTLMVPERFF
jgi:polysaccharide biosynthesis/export protein